MIQIQNKPIIRFVQHPLFDPHVLSLVHLFTNQANEKQALIKLSFAATSKGKADDLQTRIQKSFIFVAPAAKDLSRLVLYQSFLSLSNDQIWEHFIKQKFLQTSSEENVVELNAVLSIHSPKNLSKMILFCVHKKLPYYLEIFAKHATTLDLSLFEGSVLAAIQHEDTECLKHLFSIKNPVVRRAYINHVGVFASTGNLDFLTKLVSIQSNRFKLTPEEQSKAIKDAKNHPICQEFLQKIFASSS